MSIDKTTPVREITVDGDNLPLAVTPPSGSINITENGSYDVTQYASAVVNVSGGARLPAEYQEVEYLQSDGAQWIDTGVGQTNRLWIYVDFMATEQWYGDGFVACGAWSNDVPGTYYPSINSGYGLHFRLGSPTRYTTDITPSVDTRYKVTLNCTASKCYALLGKDIILYLSSSVEAKQNSRNLWLFGSNDEDEGLFAPLIGRIYRCTIECGNGNRDFIPCYRKADSKPGMYDIVNSVFYTNQGTGEFTVGGDV